MLLVIDVGNTNVVIGVYRGEELVKEWRIRTERNATEDEFNVLVTQLFSGSGIRFAEIENTIISCVVPPMVSFLDSFCRKYLMRPPYWVDAKSAGGMPIRYSNPSEVGADRIVNAVAAYDKYRTSLIVIDFGTATTFDCISEAGEYLGGAISPGIMIAAEALFKKASKLPRVEIFATPEKAIGKDTAGSIKSGVIFGYAGLVEGMVRRIREEMAIDAKVIATGGLAPLMAGVCPSIEAVEPHLTLEGLRLIYSKTVTPSPNGKASP
jgi:type III pantothenate kinase